MQKHPYVLNTFIRLQVAVRLPTFLFLISFLFNTTHLVKYENKPGSRVDHSSLNDKCLECCRWKQKNHPSLGGPFHLSCNRKGHMPEDVHHYHHWMGVQSKSDWDLPLCHSSVTNPLCFEWLKMELPSNPGLWTEAIVNPRFWKKLHF